MLSKSSTIDSGITIGKRFEKHYVAPEKCLLDKDIIQQSKAKFWNSTSETSASLVGNSKIEKLRESLPDNQLDYSIPKNCDRKLESSENKFVVNLFESRLSQRIKEKSTPKWPDTDKIEIIENTDREFCSVTEDGTFFTAVETQSFVSIFSDTFSGKCFNHTVLKSRHLVSRYSLNSVYCSAELLQDNSTVQKLRSHIYVYLTERCVQVQELGYSVNLKRFNTKIEGVAEGYKIK